MKKRSAVSFKELTTFKVGGSAASVVYPETKEELRDIIKEVRSGDQPLLILGGGSNVVASEEDFDGVVVIPSMKEIIFSNEDVVVGAGAVWDELVLKTIESELWGLENLSHIPGTVGGGVFQNIGAYGSALSETVVSVDVYDVDTDSFVTFSKEECEFGYRTSSFKKERGRYVIVSLTLKLHKGGEANTSYKDLKIHFGDIQPSLREVREAVINIRNSKFPDLSLYGTAGSFFLNPVVSAEAAARFKKTHKNIPLFLMPEGGVKVPLAWFLDYKNGVMDLRDVKVGGAFVWEKQPLVIATDETGTAHDVYALTELIKEKVKKELQLEINFEVTFL